MSSGQSDFVSKQGYWEADWDVRAFQLFTQNDFWEADFVCQKGNLKIDPRRAPTSLRFNMFWLKDIGAFSSFSKNDVYTFGRVRIARKVIRKLAQKNIPRCLDAKYLQPDMPKLYFAVQQRFLESGSSFC
jgi:hypothetical protein